MKNLFKNLMLVAVAAMAFTACSQDVNEVNNIERVTRYEFTANIADDTRSGFAEKEEGATAYKSEWFGDETLKLFVTDYGTYNVETTATINKEGQFTLELENAPESFFMTVNSPAESWSSEYSSTIPAEQTPLANSVDPKAHLLQHAALPVSNGVAEINLTHQAAYGKMTVKGVDFTIDHVVVDLKGSFYGSSRELSYTINADNVENNTFWFATEPIDVAEFTVTAYDAEGNAVTKTVDVAEAGKTMSFQYGRVGTFSVSGLEVPAEPDTVMDSAKYYYNYNDYGGYDNWGYVVFEDEFLGTLVINFQFKDGLYLKKGAYDSYTDGQRYDTGYSYYNVVGSNPYSFAYYWDYDHVVNVDVVDGKYSIVFDVKNQNGDILNATYVGDIDGLGYPDPREILAKPSGIQTSVSGKTITIRWDAVVGAEGYRVKLYSPYDEYFEEVVTNTEYVYTAQLGNTNYSFTIMSYASDDSASYISSDDAYVYVTTEDTDPKMEISESTLTFSADGGEKTFNVTLKNTDAEITYTQDGNWFSVEKSGNTFTVTAEANESETDARNGSITVVAGELSQTITLTQSKKPAASTGGGDSGDSDAINLLVLEKENYMPAKYSGYCNFCLVDAEGKNFIRVEVNNYPLLETTYVYSASYTGWDSGTFYGPGTYISLSGPNSAPGDYSTSVTPKDGGKMTVTKTGDNDNYHIVFDFELPDGTKYNAVFDGQINFI